MTRRGTLTIGTTLVVSALFIAAGLPCCGVCAAANGEKVTPAPEALSSAPTRVPPAPPPSKVPPEKAPRIEVEGTTFDFGEMYQMEEVTHEFTFTNRGKGTLTIRNITATCGCTAATPSKREFAPGEHGTIKVTFHSKRFRDRVTKHVYVDTNDPVTPRTVLTVTGVIKVEVEVKPSSIYIGRLEVGEVVNRTLIITPVAVKKFKVLWVKTNHPALTARVEPMRKKPGAYRLKVRFGPLAKPGKINAKVTVHTDLPHAKDLSISVFGRVVEPTQADDQGSQS